MTEVEERRDEKGTGMERKDVNKLDSGNLSIDVPLNQVFRGRGRGRGTGRGKVKDGEK